MKCSVKAHKFVLYEFASKNLNFIILYISYRWTKPYVLLNKVPINLLLWQKFLWQTLLSKKNLWQKLFFWLNCVSLTETQTKTCFCDRRVFSEGFLFSDRNFCPNKNLFLQHLLFFYEGNLFLPWKGFVSQKLVSVTETCSVKNIFFGGYVMHDFQEKVTVRNGSYHYLR